MANNTVEYRIVAKDEASSAFKNVAGAVLSANIAFTAIQKAAAVLKDTIQSSLAKSEQYRQSFSALSAVAGGFGIDAKKANDAAMSLANDGLLSVSDVAKSLRNLFGAGLDLNTSIKLMDTLKNSASANRRESMSLADQVVTTTEGIKNQNSVLTDNSGISTNYNTIVQRTAQSLGVTVNQLDNSARAYAVANGFIKEGAIYAGFAAQETNTLSGQQSQLTTTVTNLKVAIGQSLTPAVTNLIRAIGSYLSPVLDTLESHIGQLQVLFYGFSKILDFAVWQILNWAKIAAAALQSLFTLSLEPVKAAISNYTSQISTKVNEFWVGIVKTADQAVNKETASVTKAVDQQTSAMTAGLKKVMKAREDETYNYNKQLERQETSYKRSLASMMKSHQDKADSLAKDLKEENDSYAEAMAERTRKYNQDLTEENTSYSDKMGERKQKYEDDLVEMQDAHAIKVKNIKDQIDEERRKGDDASQRRLALLQIALDEEEADFTKTQDKKKKEYENETTKLSTEHDKRLANLSIALEEETQKAQDEHNKKVTALEKEKADEMAILEKHKGDREGLLDLMAEDDISRLKREYAEEKKASEEEHKRKLSDIATQGDELGTTMGSNLISGLKDEISKQNVGGMLNFDEKSATNLGQGFGRGVAKGIGDGIMAQINDFNNRVNKSPITKAVDWFWSKVLSGQDPTSAQWQRMNFDDGGFVPSTGLAMVHAGEFVLSRDMLAGRQSVPNNVNTYNSPVTVNATISSPADINVIANRIAWAVRNSR